MKCPNVCALAALCIGFSAGASLLFGDHVDASSKPRLIVLTDIGAEPDDAQSLVRLLVYANDLDIEGLIATTSTHMREEIHPELIEERVRAYGEVLPKLRIHAHGYPEAETLMRCIRSGSVTFGMGGVGDGQESAASRLIIEAVDKADARPVWISIWGGASTLAQALWTVRATRSVEDVERFVAKLRVYSISDQDDAGPWARATFPKLFWIVSVHGPIQYNLSAWTGVSADVPGSDPAVVSRQWLDAHIRSKGPLGAVYPRPMYIMEGDTPSFLYLLPNGLGHPEHPDWGSWGGRYGQLADFLGLWTDVLDSVRGVDGNLVSSNKATIWRWRGAYQNDFAARMDWSVKPLFEEANHPPLLVLNGEPRERSLEVTVNPDEILKLSAVGSSDPDHHSLSHRWWWYQEVSGFYAPTLSLEKSEGLESTVVVRKWMQPFNIQLPSAYYFHVILETTDNGSPALTRYRRVVLTVPTAGIPTSPPGVPWWKRKTTSADSRLDAHTAPETYSSEETEIGVLLAGC